MRQVENLVASPLSSQILKKFDRFLHRRAQKNPLSVSMINRRMPRGIKLTFT